MKPLFDRYRIAVYAISKDSVKEAALHRRRDSLELTLISDPDLRVIEDYGLVHHKALEFRTWTVLGVPLGLPSGFVRMAIPTTLIVDDAGIIRFIDQADDYRMRGDESRITRALEEIFDR